MLMTLDENLRSFPVPVRVGRAVDVVGQAGCPKTITGFRTLTTPVLLASGERAELATEKYRICKFLMHSIHHIYSMPHIDSLITGISPYLQFLRGLSY